MKDLLQNRDHRFNEVLFQGRNKSYGAYAIRTDYEHTLVKAMFSGIVLFAVIAATPFVLNSLKETPKVIKLPGEEHVLKQIPVEIEKEPKKIEAQPQTKTVKTVSLEMPNPTRKVTKEVPVAKVSDTEDANIGLVTTPGIPPTVNTSPPAVNGPVTTNPPLNVNTTIAPKVLDNTPKTAVDVSADFVGGINAFRNKVISNFNTDRVEGSGTVFKTTVVFIVEKDGTISEVIANGPNTDFNKEAEKTIKSIRGKWTPAKLDGQSVRSYFRFPISMQLE